MSSEILGNPLPGCYAVIVILHSRSGALGQVTAFPEVLTYSTERNRCRVRAWRASQALIFARVLCGPIVALDLLT